jgi:hypothetical protein
MSERNRRNRRYSNRNPEKEIPKELKPEINYPECSLCQKPIKDIYSSIIHRDNGNPAHFDCVIQELQKTEVLSEGERICYLGSGVFAVMRQTPQNERPKISIRKKIQYEDKDKSTAWKRSLNINVG